jgi:ubiquinone/menaquinone biosynthesis C-methylase UbiE
MVARAGDAAAAAGVDATVAVGDAAAPDFPPASFDVVTAGLVLFFLPDPIEALRRWNRLLRPGGRVAFTSFRAYDPVYPQALRTLRPFAVDPPPPPQLASMFDSPEGLADALVKAGFGEPAVESFAVYSHFADSRQFFAWVGSHAGGALVNRIPPENRDAAAAALADLITGPFEMTTQMWFSTGTKV